MRKRFLSALLFGVLALSTTVVTSCKDYDDDIQNLQNQIDKLASAEELRSAVSTLNTAVAAAASDASSALSAAQSAQATANSKASQADIDAAKAALEAAIAAAKGEAIAAAQDDLAAAKTELQALIAAKADQATVDAANEKIAAAEKNIEDLQKLVAQAQETFESLQAGVTKATTDAAEALAKAALVDGLQAKVSALEAAVGSMTEASINAKIAELEAKLNGYQGEAADLGIVWEMVTSVDLVISNDMSNILPDNVLDFVFVSSEKTTKFPATDGVADSTFVFSAENKNVTTTDELVVRVSPTNADLRQAKITLINSQGKELENVAVKKVKPFTELLLGTRAAGGNNGLWTVEFEVTGNEGIEKLAEQATVKRGSNDYAVKFAVAVNNTEDAADRRVISEYDVEVLPSSYEPASSEILVKNSSDLQWKAVTELRNRFAYGYPFASGEYGAYCNDHDEKQEGVPEYKWVNEPQVAGTTDPSLITIAKSYPTGSVLSNTQSYDADPDVRYNLQYLEVASGQEININVASFLDTNRKPKNGYQDGISGNAQNTRINATGYAVKGFYVTLDKDFAIESSPSEYNAWKKYTYDGVGIIDKDGKVLQPAHLFPGKTGSISITDNDADGDVIGFRVYVVNLDGTLVDPDGRAFYVRVGTPKDAAGNLVDTEDALEVKLTDDNGKHTYAGHWDGTRNRFLSEPVELTDDILSGNFKYVYDYGWSGSDADRSYFGYVDENGNVVRNGWQVINNASAFGNNVYPVNYGSDVVINFLDKDSVKLTGSIEISKIKFAQVEIKCPYNFLDDGEYTISTTLFEASTKLQVRDITLSFKKVLPTSADIKTLSWDPTFPSDQQVFTNVEAGNADIYKLGKGSQSVSLERPDGSVGTYDEPMAVRLYDKFELPGLNYGANQNDVAANESKSWYTLWFGNMYNKNPYNSLKKDTVQYAGANLTSTVYPYTNKDFIDLTTNNTSWNGFDRDGTTTDYKLQAVLQDIDNSNHYVGYYYDFGRISMTIDWNKGQYYVPASYIVKAEKSLTMKFQSWLSGENVGWADKDLKAVTVAPEVIYEIGKTGKSTTFVFAQTTTPGVGTTMVPTQTPARVKYTNKDTGKEDYANIQYYEVVKNGEKTRFYFVAMQTELPQNNVPVGTDKDGNTIYGTDPGIRYFELSNFEMQYQKDPDTEEPTTTPGYWWQYTGAVEEYELDENGQPTTEKVSGSAYLTAASVTNLSAGKKSIDEFELVYYGTGTPTASTVQWYYDRETSNPGSSTAAVTYYLRAFNNLTGNYSGTTARFGTSAAPVSFYKLISDKYLELVNVTTDRTQVFDVVWDNNKIELKQKAYSSNPTGTGHILITVRDCFGYEKTFSLDFTIVNK